MFKSYSLTTFSNRLSAIIGSHFTSVNQPRHKSRPDAEFETENKKRFAIFDRNCRLSRKRYEICSWLLCNRSHKWRIDPCRFRWLWVTSDPDFKVMTFFWSRVSEKWCVLRTK